MHNSKCLVNSHFILDAEPRVRQGKLKQEKRKCEVEKEERKKSVSDKFHFAICGA